jgi:hypothetical protein
MMGYPSKKRFLLEVGVRPDRIRRSDAHQCLFVPQIGGVNTRSVRLISRLVSAKLRRYIGVKGRANGAYTKRGNGSL